ncbi:hypothetical protein [Pseudonocardia adelaidensis]|uniref:GAF domain-containing protein n=1 Tax=Pseudonocardia adelaidensis TaxID=648754 RepID=A0ABP9NJI2_9PSEU
MLDRVLALHGTARLIREAAGADAGFVAEVEGTSKAVIRWLAGNRTDSLQDLAVPIGQGVGGRVPALARPVRVGDYVSARSITHPFDGPVSREDMSAMIAVPVIGGCRRRCTTRSVIPPGRGRNRGHRIDQGQMAARQRRPRADGRSRRSFGPHFPLIGDPGARAAPRTTPRARPARVSPSTAPTAAAPPSGAPPIALDH